MDATAAAAGGGAQVDPVPQQSETAAGGGAEVPAQRETVDDDEEQDGEFVKDDEEMVDEKKPVKVPQQAAAESEQAQQPGGAGSGKGGGAAQTRTPPAPRGHVAAGRGKGSKGKGRGGLVIQCKACWKLIPALLMPLGSDFCWPDKRALDNIYNSCKKQGQSQFWNENRYNDDKRTALVKRYHERHPELMLNYAEELKQQKAGSKGRGKGRGQKRAPRGSGVFDVVAYKEETQAAQEILKDVVTAPKTYDQFEKDWIATGGNSTSAKVEWARLKDLDDAVPGKTAAGVETLEVEIGRSTTYRDRFTRQKTVTGTKKDIQNPTLQQVEELHRQLLSDMDKVGSGEAAGLSMSDIAKQMSTGGSSSSQSVFAGGSMAVGDVTTLLASPEKAKPPQRDAGAGGAPSAESGEPVPVKDEAVDEPPAEQENKWFNVDRSVAIAVRKETKFWSTLEANYAIRQSEMTAAICAMKDRR